MKTNNKYVKISLSIVLSYILIKCIDNYRYFFDLIGTIWSLFIPLIIALILGYALNPIVCFFDRHLKTKRLFSIIITYELIILILTAFLFMTTPVIINSISEIITQFPIYLEKSQSFFISLGHQLNKSDPETVKLISEKIYSNLPQISSIITNSIGQIFTTTFSISKIIVQLVLGLIIGFYLLLDPNKFIKSFKMCLLAFIGENHTTTFITISNDIITSIGTYFYGKFLDSFIVGVISFIGLYLIGSEYSLLFGLLIMFMNLIPYFGPIIGMIPVVTLNVFYNPHIALYSLIYLILVQQVEMALIEPKIVGEKLGLSPIVTILSVSIGGGLFGVFGMILAAPIMSVFLRYFSKYINKNLQANSK